LAAAPVPVAIGADQPFWDALAQGRLEMQRCAGCGTWRWPAVWRCSDCGSWEQAWVETPMRGQVFAFTRTHHVFGGLEQIRAPFVTVVVELETAGGRRLVGLLEGDEAGLRIGAPVIGRVDVTPIAGETIPAIRWRLHGGAA
jgi:uncharacterized OB-fold protein